VITDIIAWLQAEIETLLTRRPLGFDQWVQLRRLRRAVRALRLYAADDINGGTP
jgi:hypothetical protein